ncbi:MAG: accessory gene regulator B family protein [Lachnospiraceae bacterium]|nr:accessory gene regulator B family protein [Lachnospiraceae bacterium]
MEHLAKKLTNYILKKGIITEELVEIYQYGFQCFLELSVSTICSIIIALFLGMLPECLFFFLLFIPMRSYGGGLHMKTYFACFIGSCFILTSSLLTVKYLTIPLYIAFTLYIFTTILILFIGPVDHPNREVDVQDNRTFIKRTHFTMLISFLLALFFIFTQNTKYMFLQAIVFTFIFTTSLIGRLIYKQS